ncbi:MAG TPA: radical SAM protein [Candidatus Nanoarchaeia archaeon]|nr:radical SAM protein [Candidatus Nanoarchaeia archaeon]
MKFALISLQQNTTDPPLGLAYLSAYLKKYSKNNEIKIIDKEDILENIKNNNYDLIGISAMTTDFKRANSYAKEIKKISKAKLIIGGVHITIMPHHLEESEFDIGIIGEGEKTILELINLFNRDNELTEDNLKNIKGLIFKTKNYMYTTPPRELITNLDEIPYPDRNSLKMKEIYLLPQIKAGSDNIGIFTTIFTSRGCPYNCPFCSSSSYWNKKIRFHSANYVINEIELLYKKYKVEGIHISDDLFIADKKRVKEIANKLEENGLNKKIRFSLLLRSNLVDEDLIKDLKKMNVTHVGFGFESGSTKILKYLKKNTLTVEDHKNAVKLCKKYNFQLSGSFLIGCPNETKEDILETFNFIEELNLNQMNVNQLIPMPKTDIWNYAKEEGLVNDSFEFTIKNLSDLFVHNYNPSLRLSKEIKESEFKELFDKIQERIKNKKSNNFSLKLTYLKYLKNPRFILKLFKRRNRILFLLGIKKKDIEYKTENS